MSRIWEVVFIQDVFPQVCEEKFLVIYHKVHHLALEVICCVLHRHLKSPPYAVIQTPVVLFNIENIWRSSLKWWVYHYSREVYWHFNILTFPPLVASTTFVSVLTHFSFFSLHPISLTPYPHGLWWHLNLFITTQVIISFSGYPLSSTSKTKDILVNSCLMLHSFWPPVMWSQNPHNKCRRALELKPIPSLWTSENRNRWPLELRPVATSVVWSTCHPANNDNVLYEIGLNVKRHPMSLGHWIYEQRRICEAPRHNLPTDRIFNLQCLCLATIHHCYGAVKANFYHIKVQNNAPYMACNVYTYHVCYKDPDFLECLVVNYNITLYVKYGFHPHSNQCSTMTC